jgi:hypothetical protein
MKAFQIGDYYYFDCSLVDQIDPIVIEFGDYFTTTFKWNQLYHLSMGNICLSIFQPLSTTQMSFNTKPILGALFLRNFLTVFDYRKAQIGFGISKGPVEVPLIENSQSTLVPFVILSFLPFLISVDHINL